MLSMPSILASVPMAAEGFPFLEKITFFEDVTNSAFVAVLVVGIIVFLSRKITRRVELVPSRLIQNGFEAVVVLVYDGLEGIVGKHMIAKCFPLLATIFLFTLISNWLGLIPGVGTIGFAEHKEDMLGAMSLGDHMVPLLRPVMADLNMTLGMALVFMVFWLIWTLQEVGIGGFINHTFGPKGGLKGMMALGLMPVFLFVGVIELISILFRPVSLSLRLFGNIYAGENLLHVMQTLGDTFNLPGFVTFIMSVLLPLPFYFLELLVGLLQALVFTLLCAVYIQLSTAHEEEEHGHAEHGEAAAH